MVKVNPSISQEEFDELHSLLKKERFYHDLFSSKLPFREIIKYYRYLNEQTEYITMHKTKGSGIENVLVVLEEYFWNEYNFNLIVDDSESDSIKKSKNMKLFYVACSRAINNLTCVKIVTTEEERALKKSFPGFVKIDVEL